MGSRWESGSLELARSLEVMYTSFWCVTNDYCCNDFKVLKDPWKDLIQSLEMWTGILYWEEPKKAVLKIQKKKF